MRNAYEIARHGIIEPNLFEVRGTAFCIEDLFEFVGKDQFVCTFVFRGGSTARATYGQSIVGTVVYSPKQHALLVNHQLTADVDDPNVLRVRCLQPDLSQSALDNLRYRGVSITDVAEISKDLTAIRWVDRTQLLVREIERSGVSAASLKADAEALAAIQHSIENFVPHVLLTGKKQIYWDLEGYLHMAMRHVKEMQVGSYKGKTPFPYKAADLETLVEQVVRQIEDEIRKHFERPPPHSNFGRHGKMAVYFNGDYFNVKIDPAGRLVQLHAIGERLFS